MQARHQAGALPQAHRGVRRHPQGGLLEVSVGSNPNESDHFEELQITIPNFGHLPLQVEEEPQEGAEARHQEVVLRPYRAIGSPRRLSFL